MKILDVNCYSNSTNYDTQSRILAVKAPATVAHAVAIVTTILRLLYRWRLSRFSWEDTWATLALICDMACLASIWMQVPPGNSYPNRHINLASNWLQSLTITSTVWFARMSILSLVVRIANPASKLRCIAYCVGVMFLAMDAGILAQKIFFRLRYSCHSAITVAIAQLVTDVISDTILVAAPIRFLRDMKLARDRRIPIISAFSASMLITGVTIPYSALRFREATSTTMIIDHVKAALALFVCNALVLVMFVYRLCHKSAFDFEYHAGSHVAEFTSVISLPGTFSTGALPTTSEVQTKTPTSTTSVGYELDPTHTRNTAARTDAENTRNVLHSLASDRRRGDTIPLQSHYIK
ncbi:hypothetical protein L210DRAFT_3204958 [Boletus edulis BED1]|uniref:Rhodopsin domain-containing protein n=1 Tax=Boletus edulis BED1 TaxID=1328754 RepID=A0AAD4BXZ9_BOLED|nr:hypothetical protein L210DRAFT_3204958 [Boletus edulis BED1]